MQTTTNKKVVYVKQRTKKVVLVKKQTQVVQQVKHNTTTSKCSYKQLYSILQYFKQHNIQMYNYIQTHYYLLYTYANMYKNYASNSKQLNKLQYIATVNAQQNFNANVNSNSCVNVYVNKTHKFYKQQHTLNCIKALKQTTY